MSSKCGGGVKVLEFEQKYVHSIYDHLVIQKHATSIKNIDSVVTTATMTLKGNYQTRDDFENTNDTLLSKNGKCWTKIVQFLKEFSSTSIVGDIGKHFNHKHTIHQNFQIKSNFARVKH